MNNQDMPTTKRQRLSKDTANNILNKYSGYKITSKYDENVTYVDETYEVSSQDLFDNYISKRRPFVIKKYLNRNASFETMINKWKDLNYLRKRVGDVPVHIEKRKDFDHRFGKARSDGEVIMPFCKYIDILAQKTSKIGQNPIDQGAKQDNDPEQPVDDDEDPSLYYLSTQPTEYEDNGIIPSVMTSPVRELQGDFPVRPDISGNLLPSNFNLWMGGISKKVNKEHSNKGSSSGLHHDFHDNFYCLISGQKHFLLYSPADAHRMNTKGEIVKIHENGRIQYENEDDDNFLLIEYAHAQRKKEIAEDELAEAEKALENGIPNADERVEEAEEALQVALDKILDVETKLMGEDYDDCDDDDSDDDINDFDKDELGNESENSLLDSNQEEDESNQDQIRDIPDQMHNFCDGEIPDDVNKIEVTVSAGDLLYLPAGWFHEVTSYASDNEKGPNFHLAFNYWYFPPTVDSFENPYGLDE